MTVVSSCVSCTRSSTETKPAKQELRHRMLHHPYIGGNSRHLPIPYDGGDEPIRARTLKAIVRRSELPSDIFDRTDLDSVPPS